MKQTNVFDVSGVYNRLKGVSWNACKYQGWHPYDQAFAHGAMGRRIDPSWGGPIELSLSTSREISVAGFYGAEQNFPE